MTSSPQGVFVIARDGDVLAFREAATAASYGEAVDVEDGEYEAFFTIGGVLQPPVLHDDAAWVELEQVTRRG